MESLKIKFLYWNCSFVSKVLVLPGMHEVLGLISSAREEKRLNSFYFPGLILVACCILQFTIYFQRLCKHRFCKDCTYVLLLKLPFHYVISGLLLGIGGSHTGTWVTVLKATTLPGREQESTVISQISSTTLKLSFG